MGEKQKEFSLAAKALNGGIAGIVGHIFVFPIDLIKTRLQNQTVGPGGEKLYKNPPDAFIKIFKSEGFFGLYRGLSVLLVFATPEKAIKLAANDFFRFHFKDANNKLTMFRQLAAGGLAGACQAMVTTPMELVKIQMQDEGRVAALEGTNRARRSAVQVAIDVIKKLGFFGLYKGATPSIARCVFFSIIYFPLFALFNEIGPRKANNPNEAQGWVSFAAGLGGASAAAFFCTPIDVVKTRIQTLTKSKHDIAYTGTMDAVMKILKMEGPTAFFKGAGCRIMILAPLYGTAQVVYFFGIAEYLLGINVY